MGQSCMCTETGEWDTGENYCRKGPTQIRIFHESMTFILHVRNRWECLVLIQCILQLNSFDNVFRLGHPRSQSQNKHWWLSVPFLIRRIRLAYSSHQLLKSFISNVLFLYSTSEALLFLSQMHSHVLHQALTDTKGTDAIEPQCHILLAVTTLKPLDIIPNSS